MSPDSRTENQTGFSHAALPTFDDPPHQLTLSNQLSLLPTSVETPEYLCGAASPHATKTAVKLFGCISGVRRSTLFLSRARSKPHM